MRVLPIRFTADPVAMTGFFEALGLRTALRSDDGGWVTLEAAGGLVGLHQVATAEHPHRAGEDSLSFESDEPLEDVQARLSAAGFPSTIVDESFGRSLAVVDPDGVTVVVNESSPDEYGYSRPEQDVPSSSSP